MDYDAIIIGGSFAGLSAAIYVARARRKVRVIDAGFPRNRFAAQSHGFFGHDGSSPGAMLDVARAQVSAYPSARITDGRVVHADKNSDGFAVTLESGEMLNASRLVLAYGISDILPEVSGLSERWGHSVIHCPYCHGFEFGGRQLGVLYSGPMSAHQAKLVTDWGPTTLFLNGHDADQDRLDELVACGVVVEQTRVVALHGDGPALSSVELRDGRDIPVDALFVGPAFRQNSTIGEKLGCEMEGLPLGHIIRTDAMKETSVAGVFAAGDIARGAHSVTWASADGVTAGVALHRSLVF